MEGGGVGTVRGTGRQGSDQRSMPETMNAAQRTVVHRETWRRTVADVEEIAWLLSAGGKLLRRSGALLSEPSQCSRRDKNTGHHVHRRKERGRAKSHGASADSEEQLETVSSSDNGPQRNPKKGAPATVLEDEDRNLLPGVPEDIALNHILTKIDWVDLLRLSSVSTAWRRAINEREVYNARLRQKSMQTLLAVVHKAPRVGQAAEPSREYGDFVSRFYDDKDLCPPRFHLAISLYNPSTNSWHQLPPIPHVNCGIPHMSACAFVAGKLYVLGGEGRRNMRYTPRKSMFMMDLVAGHRGEWEQCASMRFGRSDFACSVINGKIYIAGGWSHLEHVWIEGEVYDPEKNVWQCIESMPKPRLNYSVGILDGDLYVIGGCVFHSLSDGDYDGMGDDEQADWADVYNSRTNQWRRVDKIGFDPKAQTFVVIDNKLVSFRTDSIDVYDKHSDKWTVSMPNSWGVLEVEGAIFCSACDATQVNDEVYAFVRWLKGWPYEVSLLTSKDVVRSLDNTIQTHIPPVWTTVKCPHEFNRDFFFVVPVQL